ncbi:rod shape-determining protein [Desulfonema magnum]|uniref:Cell shape-determining protein, MreB-like n=1 Tax=Desulfonema magnum TaxID=45655 RepID=A0A975BVP7_9BACT|nr:rod shape-determining protein [Desulfonema magnum]QTA92631.1 Cell shape-determining protein, MreB-like [Desulfonema magnum]
MSNIFYVGIDLGTSRTSIATSTGKRLSATTCVGYPKDIISKKRFGKAYLLGEEALDNRLGLNMVWPLAEGVIRADERATEATGLILRHIIAEALSDKQEADEIYAAIGVPAQASFNNKRAIIDITEDFIDKILIVSEPFAVAYSIDRFDETLIVDIGGGTTDLCRMHGAIPDEADQMTLKIAGNYLDDKITKAILEKFPDVQLTPRIIRRIKEKYGYVSDVSEPVKVPLTENGIPSEYDITEILRESCLKLTHPICEAIQKLVGTFDPDFQEKLRNNIIIAGGGSRLKGIDRAIEKSLQVYGGGNAATVQDAEYCGSIGALKMCMEMPEEYWEKI